MKNFLFILAVVIISFSVFSQETDVINKKEKTTYKIISFSVNEIQTQDEADYLKQLMESEKNIFSCKTDLSSHLCIVHAAFVIQKQDIVNITGPAGIKTSKFSEKHFIKPYKLNQKKGQENLNEKERAERTEISYKKDNNNTSTCSERKEKLSKKEMTKKEKLEHIIKLKELAVQRGKSTEKYDKAIEELKKD